MLKWFKRAMLLIVGIFLVIIIAAFVFQNKIGESLKTAAVKQLNNSLTSPITINGDISISLFSNFPDASVTIGDIIIENQIDKNDPILLKLEKLHLSTNIISILKKNYTINSITLENGALNLITTKVGKTNYDIFKQQSQEKSDVGQSLNVKKTILKNVVVTYANHAKHLNSKLVAKQILLNGQFAGDVLKASIQGQLVSDHIDYRSETYLVQKVIDLKTSFTFQKNENAFFFDKSTIGIDKAPFQLAGKIDRGNVSTVFDLTISAKEANLKSYLSLMPYSISKQLKNFNSTGKLAVTGTVKGTLSNTQTPQIYTEIVLKNGKLTHNDLKYPLEKVLLNGSFSNGSKQSDKTSKLTFSKIEGELNSRPISASFALENFDDPFLAIQLDGEVPINSFEKTLEQTQIEKPQGDILFNEVTINGKVSDFQNKKYFNRLNANGAIELINASYQIQNDEFSGISGLFDIKGNELKTTDLSINFKNSDLLVAGTIQNLLPYIINANDSASNPVVLNIEQSITAQKIDLNELFDLYNKYYSSSSDKKSWSTSVFKGIEARLNLDIKSLVYDNISIKNLKSDVGIWQNNFKMNSFDCQAFDGKINLTSTIKFTDFNNFIVKGFTNLSDININKMFVQCDNFSQDYLVANNISGKVKSKINFTLPYENGAFNQNKGKVVADLNIKNGALKNYEPLEALSKYISLEDLQNVSFKELNNQLTIANGKLSIPTMQIESSALDVSLSGSHSFNNDINYKIKLSLVELLYKKVKKKNDQKATKNKKGKLNLFLTITGTVDDYKVQYDKQHVKEKIEKDLKSEKQELATVIKQEFGKEVKKDSIVEYKPEEIEFIDWDNPEANDKIEEDEENTKEKKKIKLKGLFKKDK